MGSASEQRNNDILSSWMRELNASLHPIGILLSGADAASLLPEDVIKAADCYRAFQALTDADFAAIAKEANEYCETDGIGVEEIRSAVRRTLWHWSDQQA